MNSFNNRFIDLFSQSTYNTIALIDRVIQYIEEFSERVIRNQIPHFLLMIAIDSDPKDYLSNEIFSNIWLFIIKQEWQIYSIKQYLMFILRLLHFLLLISFCMNLDFLWILTCFYYQWLTLNSSSLDYKSNTSILYTALLESCLMYVNSINIWLSKMFLFLTTLFPFSCSYRFAAISKFYRNFSVWSFLYNNYRLYYKVLFTQYIQLLSRSFEYRKVFIV